MYIVLELSELGVGSGAGAGVGAGAGARAGGASSAIDFTVHNPLRFQRAGGEASKEHTRTVRAAGQGRTWVSSLFQSGAQ